MKITTGMIKMNYEMDLNIRKRGEHLFYDLKVYDVRLPKTKTDSNVTLSMKGNGMYLSLILEEIRKTVYNLENRKNDDKTSL